MGEAVCWNRLTVKWWCLSYLTVMGTDILSDRGMFLPLRIVKQRTRDSTPQATLMGLAKWEPVRLPEPKQCRIEAEVLVGCVLALCEAYKLCLTLLQPHGL